MALYDNMWIFKTKPSTIHHIREFFTLWIFLDEVHLADHIEDDILCKHKASGHYLAASAYKAQVLGKISLTNGTCSSEGFGTTKS